MATDLLKKYAALKDRVEAQAKKVERAKGTRDALLAQFKAEFGGKTLDEAEKVLAKLAKEADRAEREFQRELDAFEEDEGKKLEDSR